MTNPFVIIGGDAAGMSAAAKAKRDNPELPIRVFEKGEWVSYAACGLPYFVKDEIDPIDDLVSVTPTEFREDRDIDLRTGHEVVAIHPAEQTVSVVSNEEQFEQPYSTLLIGTGARALEPPIAGTDLDGVFALRSMDEGDAIKSYLSSTDPTHAIIIGGGYIGVEMAEALDAHGIQVDIYEMLPQLLQPFGKETATVVEDHLRDKGLGVHTDTAVTGIVGDEGVEEVELENDTVPADLVIIGVGVTPNVEIAEAAGIDIGPTGAIATDEYGRTNLDGVYAAGDCAENRHAVTGDPAWVPLGLTANRAGRAIGTTVAGTPTKTGAIAGTAIVKAFELGAARTGIIDEERAKEAGFDPVSVTIDAASRAHYYPGGAPLTVTLVGDDESGRVLGASLVGREGAKRIDTVATALEAGLTVAELQNLDLAYAPPFSPVWDPILTAARVLSGKMRSGE